MNVYVNSSYVKAQRRIVKKNPQLIQAVKKKLLLFSENPRHPSLRLHKLEGGGEEEWSISITGKIRLIFQYISEGVLLTDIGSHDEVY